MHDHEREPNTHPEGLAEARGPCSGSQIRTGQGSGSGRASASLWQLDRFMLRYYALGADGVGPERAKCLGQLNLFQVEIHAEVDEEPDSALPALDLIAGEGRITLVFDELSQLHEWWHALSHVQHLTRRLTFERTGKLFVSGRDVTGGGGGSARARHARGRPSRPRARAARPRSGTSTSRRGAFEPGFSVAIRKAYEQLLGLIIRPPRARYSIEQLGRASLRSTAPSSSASTSRSRTSAASSSPSRAGCPSRRRAWARARTRGGRRSCTRTATRAAASRRSRCSRRASASARRSSRRLRGFGPLGGRLHLARPLRAGRRRGRRRLSERRARRHARRHLGALDGRGDAPVRARARAARARTPAEAEASSPLSPRDPPRPPRPTLFRYASSRAPDSACIIADSSFASLEELMYDLVAKVSSNIPSTAVSIAVNHVTESVKYRCGFDVHSVTPAHHATACTTPCLIVHGANDDFILPKHGSEIAHRFGGAARVDCRLKTPPGGHNSKRPIAVYAEAEAFLRRYLMADAPPVIDLRACRAPPGVEHIYMLPPWRHPQRTKRESVMDARRRAHGAAGRGADRPAPKTQARTGWLVGLRERDLALAALFVLDEVRQRSSTPSRPRTRQRARDRRSATSRSSRCSRARSPTSRRAQAKAQARARVEPRRARGRHALAAVRRGRRGRARELRDGESLDRARHARAPLHAPRRPRAARRVDRRDQARAPVDAHVAAHDEARARDCARAQACVACRRGEAPRPAVGPSPRTMASL